MRYFLLLGQTVRGKIDAQAQASERLKSYQKNAACENLLFGGTQAKITEEAVNPI